MRLYPHAPADAPHFGYNPALMSNETTSEQSEPQTLIQNRSVINAASMLAIGNVASRILGLVRDSVIVSLFGANLVNAYETAVLIPNTLFDAIRGGMVDSALVPVFSELDQKESRAALWSAASAFLSVAVVFLAFAVLILEILYQPLASITGAYRLSDPTLRDTTIHLMRLAFPAMLFMSIASTLTGLLYSLKRFTVPAFLPAIFNGAIVLVALIRRTDVTSLVFGLLLGSIAQIVIQLIVLRDANLRFHFDYKNPVIRRILRLFSPIVAGLVVNFAIIFLNVYLANSTGDANYNYMRRATTLQQFPLGLVVTALSIAILPTLSQQAAEKISAFKATLAGGIRLVIVLIIPAAAGLFALSLPIIDLLLGRGAYTAFDVSQTSTVLRLYLLGLPFAAVDQMLVFGSYARKDTLRPAIVGVIAMLTNAVVAVTLINTEIGFFGVVLADVVKHIVHTVLMIWILKRQIGGLANLGIFPTTLKAILAGATTGIVAYFVAQLMQNLAPANTVGEILVVSFAGLAGVICYLTLVYILKIQEAVDFIGRVLPKLGR